MRTWLVALLLIGVATAGAMQMWRRDGDASGDAPVALLADSDRDPEDAGAASDDAAERPTGDDVAETPAESVEGESEAPAPLVVDLDESTGERTASASGSLAGEVGDGVDRPGGAVALAEGEARQKAVALVDQAARSNDPIEQARLLTAALKAGALDKAADEKAYAALLEANARGLLNPRLDALCMRIEVKRGDSLWAICKRAEKEGQVPVTPGLVRLLNGLKGDNIYPGAKLKIPNVPVSILVEKSKFRLSVFVGELLLRRYHVGLGKNNKTPEGEFQIKTRLIDPPWFKPGVGALPPEHPENILGTRWLGFAEKEGFPEAATFGIHGTREDDSIGTESSNGCVRMHNPEVEELFEWISEGVNVVIRA
ncbi:MAG: L,D-transpeptidase family protein [Planctomycetes bacterium]|nr:L,D-transpeptidase family protein [Planctomycetota bacterium]